MIEKFNVIFLEQAIDFVERIDSKARKKIYYNIDKSKFVNDPKLFSKLQGEIWEFRTKYSETQYRLLAFWDKTEKTNTVVVSTHGIIKKTSKIPKSEIEKAERIRIEYFKSKNRKR